MSNFLFPIETTSRELDHKILMAILAAKQKRKVIVGDQQLIRNLSYFVKNGVFYGKHLFGKPMFSDDAYYKRLKSNQFNLVHLNEEGAVWPGSEDDWKTILEQAERPSVLDANDFVATWGEWQEKFNINREETKATVKCTGHPRFDLYNSKYNEYFSNETTALKKEFGDFILVNTAFSYSNNGENGVKFIFKKTLSYDAKNSEHRKYRFKRWKNQMFSIASIVELVNQLALIYPEKNIVLRPHPSENSEYYEEIFQGIDNVHVKYEGPVTPWLLACKLLIHNGCTTAIEATLAGKPVVNFSNGSTDDYDVYLANICGVTLSTNKQVTDFIDKLESGEYEAIINDQKKAQSLFENFRSIDTAKNVLNLLEKADEGKGESRGVAKVKIISLSLLHKFYLFSKYSYFILTGRRGNYLDYKKRFECFDKVKIVEKVSNMSKILGYDVKVTYCSKQVFVVERS